MIVCPLMFHFTGFLDLDLKTASCEVREKEGWQMKKRQKLTKQENEKSRDLRFLSNS